MAMIDMKRTKAERKKESEEMKSSPSLGGDDYPYGLHVHLDHEALQKLGVDKLPKVGEKLHLHAHAHVTEVSEEHRDGGKKRRHVRLQLRKMALEHEGAGSEEARDAATRKGAKSVMDAALAEQNDHDEDD